MQKDEHGRFQLEFPDVIRMNQLVRTSIDVEEFRTWYQSLSIGEQVALVLALVEFSLEAGAREDDVREAIAKANSEKQSGRMLELVHPESRFYLFFAWMQTASAEDRLEIFNVAIYMFGLAERRVFSKETKESCNHWWHRDLSNPAVVQSLLEDPKFWNTSMKDDDRILANLD